MRSPQLLHLRPWALRMLLALLLAGAWTPLLAAESGARLTTALGTVVVVRADGSPVQPAPVPTALGPGDRLATVGGATATVTIDGVGVLELGAKTTVIFQEVGPDGVTIEVVHGMTVHRLDAGSPSRRYRVHDPRVQGAVEVQGAATFGVARDEADNLTLACDRCQMGTVTFPGASQSVGSGRAVTLTARGEVVSEKLDGNLYSALAAGGGIGNDGGTTAEGNRLPAGQRTGSNDRRPLSSDKDDPKTATAPPPTPTPTPTAVPTLAPTLPTQEATISGFDYQPDPIVVQVGQTIRWTNLDIPGHTVTADDLSFRSPLFGRGGTYSLTLARAGVYSYFCEPHPFMTGTIEVR